MSLFDEISRYFAVFLYVITPSKIYDFCGEPTNTDELFDYCFPANGWICWLYAWCYWIIETILDFSIKCVVNVTQLHTIKIDE